MGILEHVGALAITGLGEDYGKAVVGVAEESLSCNMSSFHVMPLTGGERRTIGADYTTKFPVCIASTMETISAGFDQVEEIMKKALRDLVGNSDLLKVRNEDGELSDLEDFTKRTHFHHYSGGAPYPLHTDKGIYLLVTPSKHQPLQILSRSGAMMSTAGLPDDSVIFLAGTGLSSWLLDGTSAANLIPAAPHLVPQALEGLESPDRAVVARMLLPSLSATPLHTEVAFSTHFHATSTPSSHLCPQENWDSAHQAACEEGEALCWMDTCLSLPPGCSLEEAICVTSTLLPCCTPEITENCEDMDTTCHWVC